MVGSSSTSEARLRPVQRRAVSAPRLPRTDADRATRRPAAPRAAAGGAGCVLRTPLRRPGASARRTSRPPGPAIICLQPHRPARRAADGGVRAPARARADQEGDVRRPASAASCGRSGRSRCPATTSTRGRSRTCLRVLRDGGVVGIYPEGTRGDGELAPFHTGAGLPRAGDRRASRPAGDVRHPASPVGSVDSVPPRGARFDFVYGPPVYWEAQPGPGPRRRYADHRRAAEQIRRASR